LVLAIYCGSGCLTVKLQEVLLYMFDKSVWWQQLTVEKLFHIELPVEYSHHASGHHSHGHR